MILISSILLVCNLIANDNNLCFGGRYFPLITAYKRSWAKELTLVVSGLPPSSCNNMFKKRRWRLRRDVFSEDSWDVRRGHYMFDFDDLISWRSFLATLSSCMCGSFSVTFFTVSWILNMSITSFSLETVLEQQPLFLCCYETFSSIY